MNIKGRLPWRIVREMVIIVAFQSNKNRLRCALQCFGLLLCAGSGPQLSFTFICAVAYNSIALQWSAYFEKNETAKFNFNNSMHIKI